MPKYMTPTNDEARLTFLQRAKETAVADSTQQKPTLDTITLEQLDTLIPAFQKAFNDVRAQQGASAQETAESQEALRNLELHARHMQNMLEMRVARLGEPTAVLRYYGMTLDGRKTRITNQEGWLQLGQELIDGDAKAVEAGYAPAVSPSSAELQVALDQAKKEVAESVTADAQLQAVQQPLADLRQEANALIADIVAQIRFLYRREDDEALRRILRRYGAQYQALPGEAPIDQDQP